MIDNKYSRPPRLPNAIAWIVIFNLGTLVSGYLLKIDAVLGSCFLVAVFVVTFYIVFKG